MKYELELEKTTIEWLERLKFDEILLRSMSDNEFMEFLLSSAESDLGY